MMEFIKEFTSPYFIQAKKGQLVIELVLVNEIPEGICTDWNIYQEILFHIMQNAVKFSKKKGRIQIMLSYHELQFETKA